LIPEYGDEEEEIGKMKWPQGFMGFSLAHR
jgi:hypothetical protein